MSEPIKVLRVMARLNIGGPARHAIVLGRGLDERGFSSLLVHGAVGPQEGSLESLLDSARVRAVKIQELGARIHPWSDLVAFVRLARVIFQEQPDVVHTHTAKAGALGRLTAALYNATRTRRRRAVVIHTFHGHVFDGYFGPLTATAVRVAERNLARLTDRVVAISLRQKEDLSQRYAVAPSAKIDVVELGLDLSALLELDEDPSDENLGNVRANVLRSSLGLRREHIVFGYVGRFVPIKDLPALVRAFARVAAGAAEARLLLVGDGEERPVVERLITELHLSERVHLVGWQQDLRPVYGAMDAAVISSRSEGTPVALIEAMAAGRPVVAPDVGGVADIVADGRTGLVVRPGDPEALANAMLQLARDADLRKRLGCAARREVAARFTVDRLLTATSQLYRDALGNRRGVAQAYRQ